MIYMFLSNNPSSGDINSSNLPCFIWPYCASTGEPFSQACPGKKVWLGELMVPK